MPNIVTSSAFTQPTSGIPFDGLMFLRSNNGYFGGDCLVFRFDNGLIGAAYTYAGGNTNNNLTQLSLPVNVPATGDGETYGIGFQAGNPVDLIANLPVSGFCDIRTQTLIEIADSGNVQVSTLADRAATGEIDSLQAQITTLTNELSTANDTIADLNVQIAQQAASLTAQCDIEKAALQAQIDELTASLAAATANADAAAVTGMIDDLIRNSTSCS